jgi:putative addiction module component (TIGR02574 family)
LGLTYYEEHDYQRALTIGQRAYRLMPRCPLVLWDLAGTLDMLGRHREAIAIYRRLVRRNIKSLAFGDCGEGLGWARSLVADCWYRLAGCASKLGRRTQAIRCYKQHLVMRGPGCRSIYPIKNVRKELRECLAESQNKELDRRLKDYRRHPREGAPWETVKNRTLGRK